MGSTPRIRILLVDDKPSNLMALEALLESPDYELVKADSGLKAIKRVKEEARFATILLDVYMPEVDGYETARRIKELPNGRDVPIIFVTAVYKEDQDTLRGYQSGGIDYLAKPLIPEILRAKVKIYADLCRKGQELRDQRELASVLIEVISQGVIITDASGQIVQLNGAAKKIWGDSRPVRMDEIEDGAGWMMETGQKITGAGWALPRAIAAGKVTRNELMNIQSADGRSKAILNTASPVKDSKGKIVGAVWVIQEVAVHPPRPAATESRAAHE